MKKKIISIITGENTFLGSGHMQRMLNLYAYLKEQKGVQAWLIACNDAVQQATYQLYPGTEIAIRDMRDSGAGEIEKLRQQCEVLVIDDCGAGRARSDYCLDLLPHPEQKLAPDMALFLYGYNFTQTVKALQDKQMAKTVDLAIYPGREIDQFYQILIDSLPKTYTIAVLQGKASFLIKNGRKDHAHNMSYAEIILSAKAVLSHFGILLYEGHIAGCTLLSVNPTEYHSQLADIAQSTLGMVNLGVKEKVSNEKVVERIMSSIDNYQQTEVVPSAVYESIQANLLRFYRYVLSLE